MPAMPRDLREHPSLPLAQLGAQTALYVTVWIGIGRYKEHGFSSH